MGQLGFVQLIAAGISLAASAYAKKKAAKKAREQYYAENRQAIANGTAVSALSLMSEGAVANLRRVWPWIREKSSFASIDWSRLGMPNGPGLSPVAAQALGIVWEEVRAAARFDDVNWDNAAVPVEGNVAASQPLPELGGQYYPPQMPVSNYAQSASLFPGGLDAPTGMVLGAAAVAALILLSNRR